MAGGQGYYLGQLKAMLKRNILLKKREKRKTIAELLFPMYFLVLLIVVKSSIPDLNMPEITKPRGEENLFKHFTDLNLHEIAVVPDSTPVQNFINAINTYWKDNMNGSNPINWAMYTDEEKLVEVYNSSSSSFPPIAVIFRSSDPSTGSLEYEIRTNPSFVATPTGYYGSEAECRGGTNPNSALQDGSSCPVNTYYFSGFLALQMLIDYTRIKLDSKNVVTPEFLLEIFPKAAEQGDWMLPFRLIIPLYLVLALSQFITYLMMLIVGEKEKKIKEGMKIMGLRDSIFWFSWFIFYAIFIIILSTVSILLLYFLKVFSNSNYFLIYILILLYGLSVIMFAFMITPFFDKSKTAGIISNFSLVMISLLYYVTVFVETTGPTPWLMSLLSPVGFAMAMDKALVMDMTADGLSFSNAFSGSGVPFGGSIFMILFDIILYGLIAYYLDSVIPSEHGVKRSPFFCFSPSFWSSKRTTSGINNVESENISENIEPVSRDMHGKEAIQINNLFKSFKQFRKPKVNVINGINLTIYEGHITAIIGHNGAGKTTLFNILTGLTAPTTGVATIYGYDVSNSNDMDQIRRMTGVCPQHDILFDNLTPKEHLEFFAAIKGIKNIDTAVTKTLKDIDLTDKADTESKNLSGGQKRKLSVGIAIIGDPKIIILDEPTAGIDPYSRRHMWTLLQNIRKGKVILLTTHFMDEADILADRKAVVSKGNIRCCGSSLFLKNKFGIGYHLTLVLEEHASERSISTLIKTHVLTAEKDRRHGKELSFILPYNAVQSFAGLFSAIEGEIKDKSDLGISSYGVSMTSLEEVFLQLQKDEESTEEQKVDDISRTVINNRSFSRPLSLNSNDTGYKKLQEQGSQESNINLVASGLQSLDSLKCSPNTSQTLKALLKLRILRLRREFRKLFFLIVLPILLAAGGLSLTSLNSSGSLSPHSPLTLDMNLYPSLNISLYSGTAANLDQFASLLTRSGAYNLDYRFNGSFPSLLDIYPHIAAFNVDRFEESNVSISLLYNSTQQHSLPALVNLINNAISKFLGSGIDFKVSSLPFADISTSNAVAFGAGTSILGMVFLFSPVLLAVDMVYDREIKARNQLRVNGLSFYLYFISFFIIQLIIMTFICFALIVLITIFKPSSLSTTPAITTLAILIALYCPASILFTTFFSYMFDKTETAQAVMPNVALLLGFIPFILVMVANESLGHLLHIVFSFLDVMYLPYGMIYFIQTAATNCQNNKTCEEGFGTYFTSDIVVVLIALIIHIPMWFFMVILADIKKSGGRLSSLWKKNTVNDFIENDKEVGDIGQNEDQDVKLERQRVKSLINVRADTSPVVLVENLHKRFTSGVKSKTCRAKQSGSTKIAVKSISLAIDAGEVFGLLGHNGAGKTTAIRVIIAEESPTRGRVQIAGNNITSSLNTAFQLLGYCPQHDAQWKDITVKEHLEVYCAIRGVPSKDIPRVVDLYLSGLQIHEHKDKQSEKCSGGTRRKISYAMAMVGNPKIVLLDEPSTGMDPESKRFLWDTVLASFRGSKGAILTTHSMEEADALCSRVGIMVKGELRCIGSTQHLKNLYGAGYNLEIKLIVRDHLNSEKNLESCKEFVMTQFPNAILDESFADRLIFSIPQNNVSSLANCFKNLEEAKTRLNIEEYSFSQTTLEQVFLKFAHDGESEE